MRDLWYPSGKPRATAGLDRRAHARRHHDRVPRLRHRGVEEYGGAAELHRDRGIGGGANAGVEHHRYGRTCTDDLDNVLITDAKPGSDGGTKRHYGNRARIGELATDYRVLGAIGQYDEAFRYERLGGTQKLFGVGIEQLAVANDFKFNPVGAKGLACEFGGEHSILRGL